MITTIFSEFLQEEPFENLSFDEMSKVINDLEKRLEKMKAYRKTRLAEEIKQTEERLRILQNL